MSIYHRTACTKNNCHIYDLFRNVSRLCSSKDHYTKNELYQSPDSMSVFFCTKICVNFYLT
jgi:hypothetical protein